MEKKKFSDYLNPVLSIIMPSLVIIMIAGFIFEMINNFKINNYSYFINYALISLTLFGFTLIGAIFEDKNKKKPIVKKLFEHSIVFLSSAIAFFVVHSISFILQINEQGFFYQTIVPLLAGICIIIGYFGFAWGIFSLLQTLLLYSRR